MRVEGLAVACREGRHPVRLGLALVLEERIEVAVDHFPQDTVHPEDASAIDQHASSRATTSLLPAATCSGEVLAVAAQCGCGGQHLVGEQVAEEAAFVVLGVDVERPEDVACLPPL